MICNMKNNGLNQMCAGVKLRLSQPEAGSEPT